MKFIEDSMTVGSIEEAEKAKIEMHKLQLLEMQ